MAASITFHSVWFCDQKWRKVTGITQCFQNKNLTFSSQFYMLRMKFNTDLICIMGKILI